MAANIPKPPPGADKALDFASAHPELVAAGLTAVTGTPVDPAMVKMGAEAGKSASSAQKKQEGNENESQGPGAGPQ